MPPRKRATSAALPTLTVRGRFRRYPHDGSNGPFERNPVAKADTITIDQSGLPEDTTYARRAETLAKLKPADCLDRAILIQTSEHHDQIRAAFKNDKELRAPLKKKYKGGEFGENIYCSGGDADTLCIGDVLTLVPAARKSGRAAASDSPRGASNNGTLTLQVSNPRRPCSKVDLAYGKTFGGDGVRAYCARTGRAGFFVRVLQPGTHRWCGAAGCRAATPSMDIKPRLRSPLWYGRRMRQPGGLYSTWHAESDGRLP